jgi:predicted transcriptional regulator
MFTYPVVDASIARNETAGNNYFASREKSLDAYPGLCKFAAMAKHPLTAYRKKNGLSIPDLAKATGASPVTIWRWETGRVAIPGGRLLDVERITGISRAKLRPDLYAVRR